MRIAIGADHGGFELKQVLVTFLEGRGHEVIDLGVHAAQSVDYPDYALAVAGAVASGRAPFGVMIDGAGIGSAMAANKVKGIRAAVCNEIYTARNSRLHNNANVLTMGSRVIGAGVAQEVLNTFLETAFEGGRHQARVDKIMAAEAVDAFSGFDHGDFAGFVRRIVETVLERLGATEPPPPSVQSSTSIRIEKGLIDEERARTLAQPGVNSLLVTGAVIITPLAREYLHDRRISIQRHSGGSTT
ncbi:ribose 5-phosphate isomerase B [bacterium]|nr:ribose 5-phosphate isomerase B [candidate division CSSED10-310 bacterium]